MNEEFFRLEHLQEALKNQLENMNMLNNFLTSFIEDKLNDEFTFCKVRAMLEKDIVNIKAKIDILIKQIDEIGLKIKGETKGD